MLCGKESTFVLNQSLLIGLRRFKSRFGTKLIVFLFMYYIYGIILV